jgi:hypothetical protein
MELEILKGVGTLHAVIAVVAAAGFFFFWARTRFWLPKYAHVLALIALALGVWMAATVSDDAPISKQGPVAKILLALGLPVMVYFFFVFYGGQRAAYESRSKSTLPCPYCHEPVDVVSGGNRTSDGKSSPFKQQCPHCGQDIG